MLSSKTLYPIEILIGNKKDITVLKNYDELKELHSKLLKNFKNYKFNPLPSRLKISNKYELRVEAF